MFCYPITHIGVRSARAGCEEKLSANRGRQPTFLRLRKTMILRDALEVA